MENADKVAENTTNTADEAEIDALGVLDDLDKEEREAVWIIDPSLETDAYATETLAPEELQGIVLAHVDPEDVDAKLAATVGAFRTRSDSLDISNKDILEEAYEVFNEEHKFDLLKEKLIEEVFDPEDNVDVSKLNLKTVCDKVGMPERAHAVCDRYKAIPVECGGPLGIKALAAKMIKEQKLDDTFYFVDFGNVQRLYDAWNKALPRVRPHYAVKCNPDPAIIELLAANDCGFDCASATEIKLVMDAGVSPDRIIYAHPAKAPADLKFAASKGVALTTFDSLVELKKIARHHSKCQLVLRIRADDPEAKIAFGVKYGAMREEYETFLKAAFDLGLEVVGVSFHVGSMAKNASAFFEAIKEARAAFDVAKEVGHKNMRLLDIGGGYTGRFDSQGRVVSMLGDIPVSINNALDTFFGPDSPFPDVKFISEPGRYFAECTMSLCCVVHSYRERLDKESETEFVDYIISDGLYGSFNAVLYDGARPRAWLLYDPLNESSEEEEPALTRSNVYGPTCDSMDCVYKNVMLPNNMDVGDWLLFPNFGAYTIAGATNFNGIMAAQPKQIHIVSETLEEDQVLIMWSCEMKEKPSPIVA